MAPYKWLLLWLWLPGATLSWSPVATGTHRSRPSLYSYGSSSRSASEGKEEFESESKVGVCKHPYYDRFAAFLAEEIGVTDPAKVKKIVERSPTILSHTEANVKEKLDFLRDIFGYTNEELSDIFVRGSTAFTLSKEKLKSKVTTFELVLRLDNKTETLGSILHKHPALLGFDVEANIAPKLEYLREKIFEHDNIALTNALTKFPSMLAYSLDKRIIPRSKALLDKGINPSSHINMTYAKSNAQFEIWFEKKTGSKLPEDWCKGQQKPPKSLAERSKERVDWLTTALGMTTQEAIYTLEKEPQIQWLTLNVLDSKISSLEQIFCNSPEAARQAIRKYPHLLVYATEGNLKRKAAYLRRSVFKDEKAYLGVVTQCPQIIGLSLENRIKPRIEEIRAAGLEPTDLNMLSMLIQPEDKFLTWLENRREKVLKEKLW